jgi:hypothetical protein
MRKKFAIILLFSLFLFSAYGKAEAVYGIPDQTRAATLVVPLMETGIFSVHNTLTVVQNVCGSPNVTVHWEIWDIDGNLVNLFGNVFIPGDSAWVSDFGSILAAASPAQRAQLTDGSFYRGFMTIDVVTASTSLWPTNASYPFGGNNCLSGFTYYVRLLEGAANGISMIHVEGGVPASIDGLVRGFYQGGDDREEFDNHARYYARQRSRDLAFGGDPDGFLDYIGSRVFLSGNGVSRIVVWAWGAADWGATTAPGDVAGPFQYLHLSESGGVVLNATVSLPHIVNVIEVPTDTNGMVWIVNLPSNFNVYAFSFNAANFTGNPALTWEAMFESTILEEF